MNLIKSVLYDNCPTVYIKKLIYDEMEESFEIRSCIEIMVNNIKSTQSISQYMFYYS